MRKLHQHVGKQIVVPAWIAIHWVQNHAVFSQADDLTGNVLSVRCSDSKAAEQRICRQPQCKRLYSVFLRPRGKMEQLHRNFIRKGLLRVCLRGKPAHGLLLVLRVVEEIARLKHLPPETAEAAILENTRRVFHLSRAENGG